MQTEITQYMIIEFDQLCLRL